MAQEIVLADTNIIIEILKNNSVIVDSIRHIGIHNLVVSSITEMELYFGALNKNELLKIHKYLRAFDIIHINEEISKTAVSLIKKYAKSHRLSIPDSLIAAAAMYRQVKLYTLNLKDFSFIDGLSIWN